jgi:hypothetical protein
MDIDKISSEMIKDLFFDDEVIIVICHHAWTVIHKDGVLHDYDPSIDCGLT